MFEGINHARRRFVGAAAAAVIGLGTYASADAHSGKDKPASATAIKSDTHASFGPLK